MAAEGISIATAKLALAHMTDARPAWLWNAEGTELIWGNAASRLFRGKVKKSGLKLKPVAVPIRGQIPRLIRLGTMGRPSLARMQFLVGSKPASATCTCTPVRLWPEVTGLLAVGVDFIDAGLLEEAGQAEHALGRLFGDNTTFALFGADGSLVQATREFDKNGTKVLARILEAEESGVRVETEIDGETLKPLLFKAGPDGATALIFDDGGSVAGASTPAPQELEEDEPDALPESDGTEDQVPVGTDTPAAVADASEQATELQEAEPTDSNSLSALFDRMAGDEGLFTPLGPEDDEAPPDFQRNAEAAHAEVAALRSTHAEDDISDELSGQNAESEAEADAAKDDDIGARDAVEPIPIAEPDEGPSEGDLEDLKALDGVSDAGSQASIETPRTLWRVTGRGLRPMGSAAPDSDLSPEEDETVTSEDDVERISRYNFDELSRILTDRVGPETKSGGQSDISPDTPRIDRLPSPDRPKGSLVNLTDETLILNRLPIGLVVFRGQQILFANRAMTELTGYGSIQEFRAVGLSGVMPSADATDGKLGPVTRLISRGGTTVAVVARLQSITWQGSPAMLLSARATDAPANNEAAVRGFAELVASVQDEGFFEASRAGVLEAVSGRASQILGRRQDLLIGRPLVMLVDSKDTKSLREFLDRPARFAETSRPSVVLSGADPSIEILLFAEGRAGIVTGYFGIVRNREGAGADKGKSDSRDRDSGVLERVSRGVRRPLNTIIGFSDLIRSEAFGPAGHERYVEYARDIGAAGEEITTLIDELDEYARLEGGSYVPATGEIDLSELLERCSMRVRGDANRQRVLVRTAIPEHLPRISADEVSLTQAVLNLLASAIDQTPEGGRVILSAHVEQDGSVEVHIRDSGENALDLSDHFVVFRDGTGRGGETLVPMRSSVGLALTRSLLSVNACSLSVDPTAGVGSLFTLSIPAELTITTTE